MWLDRDVAQSDVVLASSSAAFGPSVVALLLFFDPGALGGSLFFQAVIAVTIGLVPWGLARNRGDGWKAFGHRTDDPSSITTGLLLGLPIVAIFLLTWVNAGGDPLDGILGRLRLSGPTVGSAGISALLLRASEGVVVGVCSWLLLTFLAIRGRDGFRASEIDVTQGLRTFGLGAVGASLVLGLLRSLTGLGMVNAVLTPLVGLAIVLIADRQIPARVSVNRSMILGPLIAWSAIIFFQSGGGFFRGDLLLPLHRAASAGILVIAVSALVAAGRTRATILLLAIATLYPTCLGPFFLNGLFGIGNAC